MKNGTIHGLASFLLPWAVACAPNVTASAKPTTPPKTAPKLDSRALTTPPKNQAASSPPPPSSKSSALLPAETEASTAPSDDHSIPVDAPSNEKTPPADSPSSEVVRFSTHYPETRAVSLLAFEKENGIRGPNYDQRCWTLEKVGVPASPGLLCLTKNARPEFTLASVYRIEEKKLRLVWQETVFTYANWLELTPILSEEGSVLTLTDRRPYSCEGALSEYRAKVSARVAPPSGELLEPACRKRGKYVYERGRFRLVPGEKKPNYPSYY